LDYSKNRHELDVPKCSIENNRKMWDNFDWSQNGEEWTQVATRCRGLGTIEWKKNLIKKMMLKYTRKNSTVLEIGPGSGRWTIELIKIAGKLVLADISTTCLQICKKKFSNFSNIEYYFIDKRLDFLESNSVDYVWSYNVFVHINPSDVANYVEDFQRILKPGGIAMINHAGALSDYESEFERARGMRSNMDQYLMATMVSNNKMTMLEQNYELTEKAGDLISVFTKPKQV